MKLPAIISASLLCLGSAMAQNSPVPFPEIQSVPQGVNPAVYPLPRQEWPEKVNRNFEASQKVAGSIELIFDGDSITDNWHGQGKDVWQKNYANRNAFNFGIGGDRTQHVLWRLEHGQVNNIHPKLVALMIGTNNLGGNTPEQIAEGVKAIVAGYQKRCPEAVILLQAVFPRGEKAGDPLRLKVQEINKLISQLGDGKKVIYVDFTDKFLQPDGTLGRDIMPDLVHPTPKGYEIWAEAIAPIIDKYVPAK